MQKTPIVNVLMSMSNLTCFAEHAFLHALASTIAEPFAADVHVSYEVAWDIRLAVEDIIRR